MFQTLMTLALMCVEAGGDGGSGDGQTGSSEAQKPAPPKQQPGGDAGEGGGQQQEDRGYPADTPVAEMTEAQQAAYWKYHSRHWQARAEGRKDYDQIKNERDQLKAQTQTAEEKAIEDARAEGRAEALKEYAPRVARGTLISALATRGMKREEIDAQLEFVDLSKFVTADGETDADKVEAYVQGVAPSTGQTWPDMGAGRRGDPGGRKAGGSVQAGRDAYHNRHKKK